jgi:hypothetical protein
MKSTRLAVAITAVVLSLLLLPAAPNSQSDPPRTGEQATMQRLLRDLSYVFGLTLNGDQLEDPGNHDPILSCLNSLAGNAEQMEMHGEAANPSTDFFRRSLARDANEAVLRFRQGQYEGTRFLIDQLVNNCFACHSRIPSDRLFLPGDRYLEDTAIEKLTAEDRARLQVTLRQFEEALDTYERLFASPQVSAEKIAVSTAFENYLRICLRVEDDCDRAIATFNRFRKRPDVPSYLDTRLELWTKDLRQLGKKRKVAQRDPLSQGRALIRDAQYHNEFPNDPRGTVRFVAATGYLHRYLQSAPTDTSRLAEAYYLLGVAESYITPSYWRSQTDVLLERSIRTSPRSVYGRMALNFLEEYTISGYTGSSGVNIPPDVQERLGQLRSLVESDQP